MQKETGANLQQNGGNGLKSKRKRPRKYYQSVVKSAVLTSSKLFAECLVGYSAED